MNCAEIKDDCQCCASLLFGVKPDCRGTIITLLFFSVIVGLLAVGALAVQGKMPYAGWVITGLGVAALGISLLGGELKNRTHEIFVLALLTTTLVTVGVLAGMGQLNPNKMAWGCMGATLAFIPVAITVACCFRK